MQKDKGMLLYEKLSFLILLILVAILVFNNQYAEKYEVYGDWRGEFKGYELFFEFKPNQRFKLIFKDKALKTSKVIKGNFYVDYSKKPISLSLKNLPNTLYPLHTIIKFKGNNLLIMEKFSTKEKFRPIIFNYEGSVELKRSL